MKRYASVLLLLSAMLIIGYGCKHKPEVVPQTNNSNNGNNNGGNGNGNGADDTTLCFERDILPIFKSNCTQSGCHDAISRQDGYQFTDYNSIVSKNFVAGNADATELYEKITEDKADKIMPPPPNNALTADQIALIRRWINEGAKNTTGCPTKCDTNTYTYSGAVQPILAKNCYGCHTGSGASGGIVLDNYADVKLSANDIVGAIRHDFGFSAMPRDANKLQDCEIRQVEKWVEAGKLNN